MNWKNNEKSFSIVFHPQLNRAQKTTVKNFNEQWKDYHEMLLDKDSRFIVWENNFLSLKYLKSDAYENNS